MLKGPIAPRPNHPHEAECDRDAGLPWLALDRFIRELERNCQVPDRFSIALAAICESTNAPVAFVYIDGAGRPPEMAGEVAPSAH